MYQRKRYERCPFTPGRICLSCPFNDCIKASRVPATPEESAMRRCGGRTPRNTYKKQAPKGLGIPYASACIPENALYERFHYTTLWRLR